MIAEMSSGMKVVSSDCVSSRRPASAILLISFAAKEVNNEQQEQERCRERNVQNSSPPTSVKGALFGANYFSRSQPTCSGGEK